MAMRPESKFWEYLRNRLPGHTVRAENTAGNGMPDVTACWQGKDIWIELKVFGAGEWSKIRKEQRIWGLQRAGEGGKVFIVALCPDDNIRVWKFPDIVFEKYDDKYQRIMSTCHFSEHKFEINKLVEYLYA